MCGIAGFTGFDDNYAWALLANKIQQHRGPDNQSVWHDDHIAFAHQRLSIIDLSDAANQPFLKHNLVIVFNGEIYNYKELRDKLKAEKQVDFTTSSDTEVVLEMFLNYGKDCLNLFIGMFAFAIYNQSDHSLFIARDHFGIKPLFYTQIGNAFAFSSELKTLVRLPGFCKEINIKSLVGALNYLWVPGNDTMFIGTFKLPPAHYLNYSSENGITVNRYWELKEPESFNGKVAEGELVDRIADSVESSVKRHMVADVPVSCFLSGGLDSSLISVLARKSTDRLSAYTIATFDRDKKSESMPDDEKYARMVAQKYDLDQSIIRISPDIIKDLPEIVRYLDEPIGDPAAINTYLICKAARDNGVKVLLSGMGADEIFFGYRRQRATLLAQRYSKLPAPIKYLVTGVTDLLPVKVFGRGFRMGRWAKRFLSFAALPLGKAYMRSYSYYSEDQLRQLLHDPYWPAIDAVQAEHQEIFDSGFRTDLINRICYTDINMFMVGLNLTYTDRASMAASVEVRVPFIDRLMVTDAMNVSGSYKFRNGISKYILKKAAERTLPKEIIYRPKASFGAPIRSWISNDLRGMTDDLLSESNIRKRGFLSYPFVKKLIEDDRNGISDNAYQIYQLLTLELWFREYLDN